MAHISEASRDILAKYSVDAKHGFLPTSPPLARLPDYFAPWEQLVDQEPELLEQKQFRTAVNGLAELDATKLNGLRELHRAKLVLSLLVHGYVWQDGEAGVAKEIPENLSKPFYYVSNQLGLPMVLVNYDIALYNWTLKNPNEGAHLDNLVKASGFLRIIDEDWFYLVTVGVEHDGAASVTYMLRALELAQQLAANGDELKTNGGEAGALTELTESLHAIAQLISRCEKVLARMHEKCDPHRFYTQVRPWLAGWKNNKAIPGGLVFKGCYDNQPQFHYGGSAAQSSLIQSWDSAFGVKHKDHATQYLNIMRQYMPPQHRGFVEFFEQQNPSIKDCVLKIDNAEVTAAFNACLSAIESFRSTHINIVGRYIVAQSTKREGEEQGTGGTSIMPLLRASRQETREAHLDQHAHSNPHTNPHAHVHGHSGAHPH